MKTLFQSSDLPLAQLEKLGIYHQGQLLLNPEEISALLSGRRTELISLFELKGEKFDIERLDARLSLRRNANNEVEVLINPIYHSPRQHSLLTDHEMHQLIEGKKDFIAKSIQIEEGISEMYNIEYDRVTNDFVGYSVPQVQAPDLVNGMILDQEQKESFQKGELIELGDGTRFQHRVTQASGLLADRRELILSVLVDGGISYLLIKDIQPLSNISTQLDHHTPSFNKALADMQGVAEPTMQEHKALQIAFTTQENSKSRVR
ncbi:DUF4099 domain-containing protein [Pedobacter soli]|uniref:DUF4099 domain-containing protein n=1 Tax=Pedobacter soli TaxID=390242 RepID=A0A1G6X235_9SPHI|nr:DUF4099 domain-containing protein [Pedobacter soli]SDD71477.1 Protein of unknown function [Pedobacter soli]